MRFWSNVKIGLSILTIIAAVVLVVMTLAGCEPANGPTDPCQPHSCVVPRASLR